MTKRDGFGFETTSEQVLEGVDMAGRRVLITGGSSGLGAQAARALATRGAHVVITGRSLDKTEGVARSIREAAPEAKVEARVLDLASLASVSSFVEGFLADHEALDVLMNNAGVMACPQAKTEDGFEMQFGTNHVGHFLLTGLLVPALRRGRAPRIVNLSSRGHHFAPVDLDDPHFEKRAYDKWLSYGQSKTANILFTVGLEKRLGALGVHSYAVHPGAIMTDLARHLEESDIAMFQERIDQGLMKMKPVEAGAATQLYAATAPELEGRGGVYLENCGVAATDDDDPEGGVRSYAVDPVAADALWAASEKMVGVAFAWT